MSKIREDHVRRVAVVYLRQSSMKQVRHNLESQRLQYALADRATRLGFKRVEVVDTDLGVSAAAGASIRPGFERVLSMVAQGGVGIILSREVSRLSRNDQDWCRLMEICQVFDTLIGDEEHVYDPSQMDDQLVLGIKGTLSVVELGVLRMRMLRGREAKAARGRLKFRLPPGYIHDADDHPVKSPDARTREAIELVFQRFRELRNARRLHVWFHDERIEMPVFQHAGSSKGRIEWQLPGIQYLTGILKNPFYAGAYVYGRRPRHATVVEGKVVKRSARLQPAEQCRVFLPDHHEAYLSWQQYQDNLEALRHNTSRRSESDAMTAVRSGSGLLVGMIRCGHCGRRLHVNYWGRSGTSPRYVCRGAYPGTSSGCLSFAGTLLEKAIEKQVLAVVSPFGIEASQMALAAMSERDDGKMGLLQRRAEQLRYEASRAFEQYDQVDPRNRLVAAELERRWNTKLAEAEHAETDLAEAQRAHAPLDPPSLARLQRLGERFEQAWRSPHCSGPLKKQIVRTLSEELLVRRDDLQLVFTVHWAGGVHTELRFDRPAPGSHAKTSEDAIAIIVAMAPRYDEGTIAAVLNRNGLTTGKGNRWNSPRVATARRSHKIAPRSTSPDHLGLLGLKQAANHCGVSQQTIRKLVASGLVRNEQTIPLAPYEIVKADLDSDSVQQVLARLRTTRKLDLSGGLVDSQRELFEQDQGDEDARYSE